MLYGREIAVEGYAEILDDLPEGQFCLARNLIWCCATDAYLIGYVVLDQTTLPAQGAMLSVQGVLEGIPYVNPDSGEMYTVPAIRPLNMTPAENVPYDVYLF